MIDTQQHSLKQICYFTAMTIKNINCWHHFGQLFLFLLYFQMHYSSNVLPNLKKKHGIPYECRIDQNQRDYDSYQGQELCQQKHTKRPFSTQVCKRLSPSIHKFPKTSCHILRQHILFSIIRQIILRTVDPRTRYISCYIITYLLDLLKRLERDGLKTFALVLR